jgi:hypothetical protein
MRATNRECQVKKLRSLPASTMPNGRVGGAGAGQDGGRAVAFGHGQQPIRTSRGRRLMPAGASRGVALVQDRAVAVQASGRRNTEILCYATASGLGGEFGCDLLRKKDAMAGLSMGDFA